MQPLVVVTSCSVLPWAGWNKGPVMRCLDIDILRMPAVAVHRGGCRKARASLEQDRLRRNLAKTVGHAAERNVNK